MKTKNIILLLVVFFTGLLYLINQKEESNNYTPITVQSNQADSIDFYKQFFDLNNKFTGLEIPREITDKHRDIVKNKPVLIYRYSHLDCSLCIEKNVKFLKDIFKEQDSCIYIFSFYYSQKDMYAFKKMNKLSFPILNIKFNKDEFPIEEYNTPYFFVLYPNRKISNIYIPDEQFPFLTEKYLRNIKSLLSTNSQ
ncbi:hypothetical protein [Parabacteroides pacaensis]|uniref:hypothetical protein n=1 Tax=Parabacteroides pacaensis TaxID=2086575 RepID=UPI000D0E763B|nr:hypothetical protein [Parabacteroides pacaensis]